MPRRAKKINVKPKPTDRQLQTVNSKPFVRMGRKATGLARAARQPGYQNLGPGNAVPVLVALDDLWRLS